jgi:hypothetical protein
MRQKLRMPQFFDVIWGAGASWWSLQMARELDDAILEERQYSVIAPFGATFLMLDDLGAHLLPKDFIETHLAFSRQPEQPKRYVHDLMWGLRESVPRSWRLCGKLRNNAG